MEIYVKEKNIIYLEVQPHLYDKIIVEMETTKNKHRFFQVFSDFLKYIFPFRVKNLKKVKH